MSYTLTSRPWWVSHAVATPAGIVVARADAVSTINRHPTDQDIADGIACNRYDSSQECHGEAVQMMVGLTDADLATLGLTPGILTPGILQFPKVIDGARPSTNRTDNPVSSHAQQRVIDLLQSEGHCDDPDPVDNTPWQKGDDQP